MSFVSEPKKLTIPDEAYYPVDRLFLFDRHNRLTWEQTFGEQARPWDKERQIKRWADTSVLEGIEDPDTHMVEYNYFDMSARIFKKFTISAIEASQPNLPGEYVYPKYIVEPTPAVVVQEDNEENTQPLNPDIICSHADAQIIATELDGTVKEAQSFTSGPFRIEWRGELRRRWLIVIDGIQHNAAALVRSRNIGGVGAPGEWITTPSGPRWVNHAQDTGDQDPRPEIPIPCRLLDDEKEAFYTGHPMSIVIYRKDMESPYNQTATQGSGGLTPEQAEALNRIDANVQSLILLGN